MVCLLRIAQEADRAAVQREKCGFQGGKDVKKWICKGLLLIAMVVLLAGCASQAAAAPK